MSAEIMPDDEFDEMIAELDAAIVKAGARVRFWTCPVRAHRERRNENGWPAGTVEWWDGVAHCTAPGCDQTSRPLSTMASSSEGDQP